MMLIDTSLWIEALRSSGDTAHRQRVSELLCSGEAHFCPPVLAELWNGVRGDQERKMLRMFEERVPSLAMDDKAWEIALDLVRKGRLAGLNLPLPDYFIAACAKRHGVGLAHKDGHLDKIMGL